MPRLKGCRNGGIEREMNEISILFTLCCSLIVISVSFISALMFIQLFEYMLYIKDLISRYLLKR